jgi:hypothetical protein
MSITAGGPPRNLPEQPSEVLSLPLTDTERITYQKAAERCGLSLADWIRDRLSEAAKREAKEG